MPASPRTVFTPRERQALSVCAALILAGLVLTGVMRNTRWWDLSVLGILGLFAFRVRWIWGKPKPKQGQSTDPPDA